jgi:hypothetical protein
MDQDREITREELHQLVWSKPTRTVTKEFGLSDAKKRAPQEEDVNSDFLFDDFLKRAPFVQPSGIKTGFDSGPTSFRCITYFTPAPSGY